MAGRNDMNTVSSLRLEHVGQITCVHVAFGDLTVLMGPQATGKSIFLQLLKLVLDTGYVLDQRSKLPSILARLSGRCSQAPMPQARESHTLAALRDALLPKPSARRA